MSTVRNRTPDDKAWREIRFMVFDLPAQPGDFDARLAALRKLLPITEAPWVVPVAQARATTHAELMALLDKTIRLGGEGLMLHRGASLYRGERSGDLLKVKPHLFAVSSDYQPGMRAGDAWMTMCWTNDGAQLHRDIPEIAYVLGKEGGEIWSDFYAVPKGAPHRAAGYALADFLLTPAVNAKEVQAHGYPSADARTNKLLPKELLDDPIMYPAAELRAPLEFGAAATLTNPARAEIMARFKSA